MMQFVWGQTRDNRGLRRFGAPTNASPVATALSPRGGVGSRDARQRSAVALL